MDLTLDDPEYSTPRDFNVHEKCEATGTMIRWEKLNISIGSPEREKFSSWQAINMTKSKDIAACMRVLHRLDSLRYVDNHFALSTLVFQWHEQPVKPSGWWKQ